MKQPGNQHIISLMLAGILMLYMLPISTFAGNNPKPFDERAAMTMIREISEFYFINFDVDFPRSDSQYPLFDFLTEEEKEQFGSDFKYVFRTTHKDISTESGLRKFLSEYYSPTMVNSFIQTQMVKFPERGSVVIYNDMIFAGWGGRGASWGLELNWDKAWMEVSEPEIRDDDTFQRTFYYLPSTQYMEDEQGYMVPESSEVLRKEIEFLWLDGRWKLNTFIDSFGM